MSLELTPDEVIEQIAFKPNNKIEDFEIWKPPGQNPCSLKHTRLSDEAEEIVRWMEKVRIVLSYPSI
jgi:hypothetical protein